jgi:lipid A ethanolaminephosphotransferase
MGLKLFRTTGHSSLLDTRSAVAWQRRTMRTGGNPVALVVMASAWMATVGNWPLWLALARAGQLSSASGYALALALVVAIFASVGILGALFSWRRSVKPALYVLLIVAALSGHLMAQGMAMDATLISSLRAKPGAFFSLSLPLSLIVVFAVPALWLSRQPLQQLDGLQQGARNLAFILLCLMAGAIALGLSSQRIDAVMGGAAKARAMVSPLNAIGAVLQSAARPSTPAANSPAPAANPAANTP